MRLMHEGIRVGEIIAYRAWRVIRPKWWWEIDERLHSVLMKDYIWSPDEPASGDVRTHGIYSCRNVVRSREEKIVSLHYGDSELLEKFRKIYRVNHVSAPATKPER